jgi:hypothetical protein
VTYAPSGPALARAAALMAYYVTVMTLMLAAVLACRMVAL